MASHRLALFVTAPVIELPGNKVVLDKKFVRGIEAHLEYWNGPLRCFLRRGAREIPFGQAFKSDALGFDLSLLEPNHRVTDTCLANFDVALLSGDSTADLLSPTSIALSRCRLAYGIEYTHQTRQRINQLESIGSMRKAVRALRIAKTEMRRRSAFRHAAGLQCNGYPAHEVYGSLNARSMLYLDSRALPEMMATEEEMYARERWLLSGKSLRLAHSGRLEPMKGAHQLVPMAHRLKKAGLNFTFDIYGAGSLAGLISDAIRAHHLSDAVRLHPSVDYVRELVPTMRRSYDLFVSAHLQSDPSCTYLESLACGVPVVGHCNRMWRSLSEASGGGFAVSPATPAAMAEMILDLNNRRWAIVEAARRGLAFAKRHNFASQFRSRMEHLADLAR